MSETLNEPSTVTYAIDGQDRLIHVDESWSAFAESNEGGRTLRPESVIGRSLWEYIRDPQLQMCYKRLLEIVRGSDRPLDFEFRCDSPLFQRHMRMTMRRENNECVTFECSTEQTIRQKAIVRIAAGSSVGKSCKRCSLCNLFQIEEDVWGEADELVQRCKVMNRPTPPTIIWTVCPGCRDRMSTLAASRSQSA
ncbi:MAG: hypothetical protein AAFU85_04730 [Planctomycetota bacterium]